MRVCLIGTSNSVYREGYAAALAADGRVTAFERYGLGASPSSIIPFFALDIDFSRFDWVIFDTAINDRTFFSHDAIRRDQIVSFLKWGVARAAANGCRSAFLIMPTRPTLWRTTISGLIYEDMAREARAPLLDGFDFLRAYSLGSGEPVKALFGDDFHVRLDIARHISTALIDKMHAWQSVKPVRLKVPYTFAMIGPDRLTGMPLERQNSLLARSFVRWETEHELELELPPGAEISAIAFNAARTNASIVFDGASRVVKSLWTGFYGQENELLINVFPITERLEVGSSGRVRVMLADAQDAPTEASRFRHMRMENSEAEICGIIYRTAVDPGS